MQPVLNEHWEVIVRYLVPTLAFFAALTATFGNLAAYLQTNLKRLLAYSTIAHAGYMMMGLAASSRSRASPTRSIRSACKPCSSTSSPTCS